MHTPTSSLQRPCGALQLGAAGDAALLLTPNKAAGIGSPCIPGAAGIKAGGIAPKAPGGGTYCWHATPAQPFSHLQVPRKQVPCPEQSGSGHFFSISHCVPMKPSWHLQVPGMGQSPRPLQHMAAEQSAPPQPKKQMHCPPVQAPLPLQPLGQWFSHARPV